MTIADWQVAALVYPMANLVCFGGFAWDKALARRGSGKRVRERTLHLGTLASGGVGTLLAMGVLRHKTRHAGFWFSAWGAVALHLGAWIVWVNR